MTRKVLDTFTAKVKVTVEGKDEQVEQKFDIMEPTLSDFQEGKKVYNSTFAAALSAKAPVREKLDDALRQQGLWDDTKEAEFKAIQKELADTEKTLAQGGISLSKARNLAVQMIRNREKLGEILSPRSNLDINTCQGQGDNEQFNCLVSCVTVYNNTTNRVFSSYENYLQRATEPVAFEAVRRLAKHIY